MTDDDQQRDEILARLNREMDDVLRLTGVMRILAVPCPLCLSAQAMSCVAIPFVEFILLDQAHQMYSHPERIVRAVQTGAADRDTVVAQFGAYPPRWLQELAQGDTSGGRL
jgi:hypothetical protein